MEPRVTLRDQRELGAPINPDGCAHGRDELSDSTTSGEDATNLRGQARPIQADDLVNDVFDSSSIRRTSTGRARTFSKSKRSQSAPKKSTMLQSDASPDFPRSLSLARSDVMKLVDHRIGAAICAYMNDVHFGATKPMLEKCSWLSFCVSFQSFMKWASRDGHECGAPKVWIRLTPRRRGPLNVEEMAEVRPSWAGASTTTRSASRRITARTRTCGAGGSSTRGPHRLWNAASGCRAVGVCCGSLAEVGRDGRGPRVCLGPTRSPSGCPTALRRARLRLGSSDCEAKDPRRGRRGCRGRQW